MGLGKIDRSLAKKAKGLGMSLICYDPYIDPQMAEKQGVKLTSFENLLIRNLTLLTFIFPLMRKREECLERKNLK